jgi:hypothetical protein
MAPGAAAAAQSGTASFGGIAVQKAMLAFASDFRRLILAFHVIILSKSPPYPGSSTPLPRQVRVSESEKIPTSPKVSTAQIPPSAPGAHSTFLGAFPTWESCQRLKRLISGQ